MGVPLKIMIVDDDRTTLEVLGAILERSQHHVISRETAIGTTLAIIREKPEVVVLDIGMPGLSGDRLATLIGNSKAHPSPMVILHSSRPRAELERIAGVCGASGVIEKTGDPTEFLRRFEAVIRAKRRPR